MTELGRLAEKFSEFAEHLFVGDGRGKATLFAEDVVWQSEAGRLVGRESFLTALLGLRDSGGWQRHEIVEASEAEGFMTFISRNHLDNGVQLPIGGVTKFNEAGQISEIRTIGGMPG